MPNIHLLQVGTQANLLAIFIEPELLALEELAYSA
jgi:hypothetical protein